MNRQEAINDALGRLYGVGLRIKLAPILPDFAAHGPMAAEAMSTLGYNDMLAGSVEAYKAKRRHLPMPPEKRRIDANDPQSWSAALGNADRTLDWLLLFEKELASQSWQAVLRTWVPRLIDGYGGTLTHGLIRAAYAVRSFPGDREPSHLQIDELARGLALWGSSYERVAGDPRETGTDDIAGALADVPRSTRRRTAASILKALLAKTLPHKHPADAMRVPDQERFEEAVHELVPCDDIDRAISRHSAAFCRFILVHDEVFQIPLIHTVTAPVCMRNLLPYLAEDAVPPMYDRLWQVSASIVARFGGKHREDEAMPEVSPSKHSSVQLAAKAVEHGDEHAIKFTEACLREDAIRPDPVYRVVAAAMLKRLTPLRRH